MTTKNNSRRRFLRTGTQVIAGAGLALGADPALTLAQAADGGLDTNGDYRALVCVYLQGGCDGFSLLVPTGNAEYHAYASSRGQLAISRNNLIELDDLTGNSPPAGLHTSASALQPLFNDGRLAMIANIGNLVEPTSKEAYENGSAIVPTQLFSHSDQEIQWQQLQGRNRGQEGWGALAADYLSAYQSRDYLTSISLAGSNYWQAGTGQRPFSMTESGVLKYAGLGQVSDWERPRTEAFKRVLDLPRRHVFTRAYADLQKRAMSITTELGAVLESNAGLLGESPIENELAAKLGMVAQLIAAQDKLGMRRQIFYVRMTGFDVHDNQNREQPELFAQLAEALAYFQDALDELGQSENVTTFTASDFGRSLTSNGDGTDHGWGNHLMAMGGAVRGGRIYGTMPRLEVDGPDSVHNGRILPTLSASQYASTLLRWLGLDDSQLDHVLPNLGNFPTRDLGFMA
ncbi:MAG: DUF1501 domain-containing protein [Granulosicoccus sp.]